MEKAILEVTLFGIPQIRYEDKEVNIATRYGLLAFYFLLVPNCREISRKELARWIWPDVTQASRMINLRKQLQLLREGLGSQQDLLLSRSDSRNVLERVDVSGITVDAWEFDIAYQRGIYDPSEEQLRHAASLYQGDLLAGYEQPQAHYLRKLYFRKMIQIQKALGATDTAAEEKERHLIEQWTSRYPDDEEVNRQWLEWLADRREFDLLQDAYRKIRISRGRALDEKTERLYRRLLSERQGATVTTIPMSKLPRLEALPATVALIGREGELRQLARLVTVESLVTLLGPGGIGKTQLAKHVAELILPEMRDGAAFVDLTQLPAEASEEAIKDYIADSIEAPGLQAGLRNRIVLLVLDNAEHVIENLTAVLVGALAENRGLSVLVTSREPLGVPRERRYLLSPLALPPRPALVTLKTAQEAAALQLFLQRVSDPSFQLSHSNVKAVAQLCRALEGIPLAIELIAASVEAGQSIPALLKVLTEKSYLFGHSPESRSDKVYLRHNTMENAIRWSYDLLTEREQEFFRRASVLKGSASLATLAAICGVDIAAATRVNTWLKNKSLITLSTVSSQEVTHYYLLEPVRQFAAACLKAEVSEYQLTLHRHRKYFVEHLSAGIPALAERENLHAALCHAIEAQDTDDTMTLLSALVRQGITYGGLSITYASLKSAEPVLAAAPPEKRLLPLKLLGNAAFFVEDTETARRCYQQCLELAEYCNSAVDRATALGNCGNVAMAVGNSKEARAYFQQCIAAFQALGESRGEMLAWDNLANLEIKERNFSQARECRERAIRLMRAAKNEHVLSQALANQIHALIEEEELDSAVPIFQEALTLCLTIANPRVLTHLLTMLSDWHHKTGNLYEAAYVLGASEALREDYGIPLPGELESARATLEEVIGPDECERFYSLGREETSNEAGLIRRVMEMLPQRETSLR